MGIKKTTNRQFGERQKDLFDVADKGENVDGDMYFTPEMVQRIKDSGQEVKKGKGIVIKTKEDLDAYFDSL